MQISCPLQHLQHLCGLCIELCLCGVLNLSICVSMCFMSACVIVVMGIITTKAPPA